MIWGCISRFGSGTVTAVNGNINAMKYQNILEDHQWPVVAQHFPRGCYIFQDDNAPGHRARSTLTYKTQNHIPSLTWPVKSPELNVIENVWLFIKR